MTLNPDKMQFRLPKVSFFGHTWSNRGLSADPKKIEAVKRMELPQDVETMRSFLRLINYLKRFSPYLAKLSDPLREICRQKMEFKLNKACEVVFQCCKGEISKTSHFHTTILRLPQFCKKCIQEGVRSFTSTDFQASDVCTEGTDLRFLERDFLTSFSSIKESSD